jgi:transposase
MAAHPLLPDPECLALDRLTACDSAILFAVRTTRNSAPCPLCNCLGDRVHSQYRRRLLDLPWQGNAVRIEIAARRFFCDNLGCRRRIFTEPIPSVAARYARKTARLSDALRELTFLVGGEAAARIAAAFGLSVSPDALLDRLKKAVSPPLPPLATPRVLGVDDFAFRRGQRYGTILVDLERHHPVDLLPDREPDTLVAWLREHPGVEIISRDRGAAYIDGATRGAPAALQVADRFHLLTNLSDALERFVLKQHATVRLFAKTLADASVTRAETLGAFPPLFDPPPQPPTAAQQEDKQARRQRRFARFKEVQRLKEAGLSLHEIARRTGFSRRSVRRYAYAREEAFPEIAKRPPRRSKITPFAAHLRRRWQEGIYNATVLYTEIVAQGFTGSLDLVQWFVATWREKPRSRLTGRCPPPLVPTTGHLAFVLMNPDHPKVTPQDHGFVECLMREHPVFAAAQALSRGFCRLVRERDVGGFGGWLEQVGQSEISELRGFARGLMQDRSAVEAALSGEWSNGQVEGQVNRLKFLKRSMYGRGGFALLRARVLHRPGATT